MFKVYLLRSIKFPEKSYVGMTIKEVSDRLSEHNNGLSKYTKSYMPWELIYYENFYCRLCADKREQFFKSGVGFNFRKLILKHFKDSRKSSLKTGE